MNDWIPPKVLLWTIVVIAMSITALAVADLACADDSVQSLMQRLSDARKKHDEGALVSALQEVPATFNASSEKPARAKLISAVAKVVKDKKAGSARVAAVDALGRLDDTKAAFGHLKAFFPKGKLKEGDPLPEAVIIATGKLAPEGGIKLLAGTIIKGKNTSLRKAAIDALGSYGKSPRRVDAAKVLLEALALWKKQHGAPPKAAAARALATLPWEMLAPEAAGALKELTGANHEGPDAWLEAFQQAKQKADALFKKE